MREATEANEEWNASVEAAETAEDYFNLALQECATEAERVNLVMQAMADQGLSSMAEKWKENNESMIANNEANAKLQEQMGKLGEIVEPIMTMLVDLTATGLGWFNSLDEGAQKFILSTVLILAAIGPVAAAINGIPLAVTEITSALSLIKTAFTAVFGFIAANPVVLLIAAIVALVATIATKGDEIQAILQKVDAFLQGVFAKDWTETFGPILGNALNGFFANLQNIWNSVMQILNGIIDFVRGVFTGDWERVWNGVKQIFAGVFNGLLALAAAPINGIISLINAAIEGINWLIAGINKIPGVSIGNIGKIPMLAEGGTVWSGSAIVGEAGPELLTVSGGKAVVQPLSPNTGKIEGLLGNISDQLGFGNYDIPFVVQVNLDGKVVGESAVQYIRRSDRGNGK